MQTRKKLAAFKGSKTIQIGDGPLAGVAAQLAAAFDAHEGARLAEAHERAAAVGTGPHLAVLQRLAREAATAALADSTVPCILRADLHQVLATAAKNAPADRGLSRAKAHAYRLWSKEPTGVLTVGDVARLRTHYHRENPRSHIAAVLDHGVPAVGFNTLPLRRLFTIAGNIARVGGDDLQNAFDATMVHEGLDGNKPEQIRARAYVRALLEGGTGVDDPILRAAQTDMPMDEHEAPLQDEGDAMPMDDDNDMSLGDTENEVPHDEASETMTEVESPITGEPLALELGLSDDGMNESEPLDGGAAGGPDAGTAGMGMGLEHMGQLEDLMVGEESSTIIEDPSSPGDELEVILRPVQEEGMEGEPPTGEEEMPLPPTEEKSMSDDEAGMPLESAADKCAECGGEHDADMEHDAVAPPGWESTVKKMKKHPEVTNPWALANWEKNQGYQPHPHKQSAYTVTAINNGVTANAPLETFKAAGLMAALRRVALHGVKGAVHASTSKAVIDLGNKNYLVVQAADTADTPSKREPDDGMPEPEIEGQPNDAVKGLADAAKVLRAAALTVEQVKKICAARGLTVAAIENDLLNGKEVVASTWSLRINDNAEVELTKVATGRGRVAGLIDLDEVIGDFMAHVASAQPTGRYDVRPLFAVKCASCPSLNVYVMPDEPAALKCTACGHVASAATVAKIAGKESSYTGYLVSADIPGGVEDRPLNAKRMFAAVRSVVADALKAPSADGRLQIEIKADEAALNRVRKVLEDRYGVYAQMQQVGPQQPGMPGQPAPMNPAQMQPKPMQGMGAQPMQPGAPVAVKADDDGDGASDNEEDTEQSGPDEDDYVIGSAGQLGAQTVVSQSGKFLGKFQSEDEALAFIKHHQEQSGFYGSVWFQDDHGGFTPVASRATVKASQTTYTVAYTENKAAKTVKVQAVGPGAAQALVAKHHPNAKITAVKKVQADNLLPLRDAARAMGVYGEELQALIAELESGVTPDPSHMQKVLRDMQTVAVLHPSASEMKRDDIRYGMEVLRSLMQAKPKASRSAQEHTKVKIEYGVVPNVNEHRGGWMPVIYDDGKLRGDTYGRGYDKDEALKLAKAHAEEEAARYRGDWDVTVMPKTGQAVPEQALAASGDDALGGPDAGGAGGADMPPAGDAGAMPSASTGSDLKPEEADAIRAAMTHFRNTGLGPVEAIGQFGSKYKDLLARFGDESAPARHMAEAEAIRLAGEVFQEPALMQTEAAVRTAVRDQEKIDKLKKSIEHNMEQKKYMRGSDERQRLDRKIEELEEQLEIEEKREAAVRKADMPLPGKPPASRGPKVSLPSPAAILGKDSSQGHPASLSPKGPIKSQQKPQGQFSDKNLGPDSSQGHPAGLQPFSGKPSATHDPAANKGTKLPDDSHEPDTSGKDNAETKSWDAISKSAPKNIRSK